MDHVFTLDALWFHCKHTVNLCTQTWDPSCQHGVMTPVDYVNFHMMVFFLSSMCYLFLISFLCGKSMPNNVSLYHQLLLLFYYCRLHCDLCIVSIPTIYLSVQYCNVVCIVWSYNFEPTNFNYWGTNSAQEIKYTWKLDIFSSHKKFRK